METEVPPSRSPHTLPPIFARAGLHTTAFYFVLFAATGAHLPFWPLWLGDWGLTAVEVGLFTSVGVAVRVVAGMAIPAIADRLDRWRLTVVVGLLGPGRPGPRRRAGRVAVAGAAAAW